MFCAHCGGSNPDGAVYCQFCGSTLTATSAPLPSSFAPPPPPTPSPPSAPWGAGAPAPAGRRRGGVGRTVLFVLVIVVVIILVVGVVSYFLIPTAANVEITGVNFQSPDNVCGLDGAYDSAYYNATAGQSFTLEYDISGNNTTSGGTAACEITSVSTPTAGFSISGANVPLAIPANSTQLLSFTVNPPGSAFTGVLTLVLT